MRICQPDRWELTGTSTAYELSNIRVSIPLKSYEFTDPLIRWLRSGPDSEWCIVIDLVNFGVYL
jgi:hypothetical protein